MAGLLIEPTEMVTLLRQDTCRVLDTRPASAFAAGHLPGAVHLDPFGLSLRDTRPAPLEAYEWMIKHLLEVRGVSRRGPVVVYGEQSDMRAARVLWFLLFFGHGEARMLDGGIERWRAAKGRLARDAQEPDPTVLPDDRHPGILATVEDVRLALDRSDVILVDTRSRPEYTGELVRAARGGCIPGAVHLEWTRNLAPDGRYLPVEALRTMYGDAGITPDKEIITYCQGGYRAAQTFVALRQVGYPRVRCYLGSWNEWAHRPDLPVIRPRLAI